MSVDDVRAHFRTIESDAQKEIQWLRARVKQIEREIKATTIPRRKTMLARKLDRYKARINDLESGTETKLFSARVQSGNTALMNTELTPTVVERHRCTCGKRIVVDTISAVGICTSCGRRTSYMEHDDADHKNTNGTTSSTYDAIPTYERKIAQFVEGVEVPGDDVIEFIQRRLTRKERSEPIRVATVERILHDTEHSRWTIMAIRICRRMNEKDIPVFSKDLASRLVNRFKIVAKVFGDIKEYNRKKFMNFTYAIKQFLRMEGEYVLADMFDNLRTRAVLEREDKRLKKCIELIRRSGHTGGYNWDFQRSS